MPVVLHPYTTTLATRPVPRIGEICVSLIRHPVSATISPVAESLLVLLSLDEAASLHEKLETVGSAIGMILVAHAVARMVLVERMSHGGSLLRYGLR